MQSLTPRGVPNFPWQPSPDPYIATTIVYRGRLFAVVYRTGHWRVWHRGRLWAKGEGGREACEITLGNIAKAQMTNKGRVVKIGAEKVAERQAMVRRLADG